MIKKQLLSVSDWTSLSPSFSISTTISHDSFTSVQALCAFSPSAGIADLFPRPHQVHVRVLRSPTISENPSSSIGTQGDSAWMGCEGFPEVPVFSPATSQSLAVTGLNVARASFVSCRLVQKPATGESTAQDLLGLLVLRSDSAQDIIEGPPHIQVSKGLGSFTYGWDLHGGWYFPGIPECNLAPGRCLHGTIHRYGSSAIWPRACAVLRWSWPLTRSLLQPPVCPEGKGSNARGTRTSLAAR